MYLSTPVEILKAKITSDLPTENPIIYDRYLIMKNALTEKENIE